MHDPGRVSRPFWPSPDRLGWGSFGSMMTYSTRRMTSGLSLSPRICSGKTRPNKLEEGDRVLFGLPFEVGDDVALPGLLGGCEDGVLEQGRRACWADARLASARLGLSRLEMVMSDFLLLFRHHPVSLHQRRIIIADGPFGYIIEAALNEIFARRQSTR